MRFFVRLALLFYVVIIAALCGTVILFVSHLIFWKDIAYILNFIYSDMQARVVVGAVNAAVILLSVIFARVIVGRQQKERTIAFDNPAGRVSVSLSAMEDLIRRVVAQAVDIKDVRPKIRATKKGLEVAIRLVLRSDASIPETTSKLQDMIRRKIQDTVGLEESVIVKIHVTKITSDKSKNKGGSEKDGAEGYQEKPASSVPYR